MIDVQTLLSVIGVLICSVAMLYMRSFSQQITAINARLKSAHSDSEKIWSVIGELRSTIQSTRENYVTKNEFNNLLNRVLTKLDDIENKLDSNVTKSECRDARHACKK